GALAFLSPLWLAALAALPILWWLLRVTPPAPKHVAFPAIALLLKLKPKEETPARTPWWLLLLRLAIAALVIAALAHPLLNPQAQLAGSGPLLIVVDDGWAAARGWDSRRQTLDGLLDRAERANRPTMLLATAPTLSGDAPRATRLARASDTRSVASALQPKPWPVDREAARRALDAVQIGAGATVVYLSDSIEDPQLAAFLQALQRLGAVELLRDEPRGTARLLAPPTAEPSALTLAARRLQPGPAELVAFRAMAEDGRLLARESAQFAEGETRASVRLTLPPEIRNRIVRLELENESSAGAVVLLDERFRRRPVGVVTGGPSERSQPLLAETYYLQRALAPVADLRTGAAEELLRRELAVLVLADVGRLPETEHQVIDAWVKKGGLLLRFAGPRLAEGADDLVPVPLRAGGSRTFGGALTWAQPAGLAAFEAASPFVGLTVPSDVKVTRQVLAEPSLDLPQRTWARLADGTPLVTADRRGDGWIVLVHTTANPDWSSLALSGLFVEMLQRIVSLSQGIIGEGGSGVLPPVSALDGFGRLDAPPPAAAGIAANEIGKTAASPRHPPGWYGSETARRALNLSANIASYTPIGALPTGVAPGAYAADRELDLKPWLLLGALALLLLDLAVSLWLRGLRLRPLRGAARAALLGLALLPAGLVDAAAQTTPRREDESLMIATLSTHFGYVRTGVGDIDEVTRAGLSGLGAILTRRTAIDPGPPVEVDLEHDELAFLPLLYWPVVAESPRPSFDALARVQRFLKTGGMIMFDTREVEFGRPGTGGSPAAQRLREILRGLDLPPLAPIPQGHVLTKAFYLLADFPGRYAGAPVWVEVDERAANDGVSSVIIGAHDWAAAWATDRQGRPLFAAVPGGETQREMALRFGVNVAMYALTGNYKGDQVHVESILERLKR
ncbi:MAG: DUF4159 domain-containing protein, partial [Alphaproteobacteria bacterium]|nr:DUF4159 domain-containing protein [Alphaproteobacteria bacterium]